MTTPLAVEICQALGHSGVVAACVGDCLVWCELGWFVAGKMADVEREFIARLVQRGFRCGYVESELEALQTATLWQIALDKPSAVAPDLLGTTKRPKYLRLVK